MNTTVLYRNIHRVAALFVAAAIYSIGSVAIAQPSGGAQTASYLGTGAGSFAFPVVPVIQQNGLTLTSSISGTGYAWYRNDTLQAQYTTKAITITSTQTGNWKVDVLNAQGCGIASQTLAVVASGVREDAAIAGALTLSAPSPDPADHETTLAYTLGVDDDVVVSVLDATGREALHLSLGRQRAGTHNLTLTTTTLASGTYTCRLTAGNASADEPFVVIK